MKKVLRKLSVILTVVMVMSAFAVPVAAGQENGAGRRNVAVTEIQCFDAEVRVIDGQLVIVAETNNGNIRHVPVQLPQTIWLDGELQPLVVEAGAVVVPTEDGPVIVPLEEFDVGMVNRQVVSVAEVNPVFIVLAEALCWSSNRRRPCSIVYHEKNGNSSGGSRRWHNWRWCCPPTRASLINRC